MTAPTPDPGLRDKLAPCSDCGHRHNPRAWCGVVDRVATWLATEYGDLLNSNPDDDPPGYWEFQARELLEAIRPARTVEQQARERAAAELDEIVLDARIVGEVMHERGPIRLPISYLEERAAALRGQA